MIVEDRVVVVLEVRVGVVLIVEVEVIRAVVSVWLDLAEVEQPITNMGSKTATKTLRNRPNCFLCILFSPV